MKINYLFRLFFILFGVIPFIWSFLFYASKRPSKTLLLIGETEIYNDQLSLFNARLCYQISSHFSFSSRHFKTQFCPSMYYISLQHYPLKHKP